MAKLSPAILGLTLALAACAPAPRPTPPAPKLPAPPPPPPPKPAADWRDRSLAAGGWSYAADPAGSAARFGLPGAAPSFTVRCDRAAGTVTLARTGATGQALAIETSYGRQEWPAAPAGDGTIAMRLAAVDPALDRIAFSRGRFRVLLAGTDELILPAWAEPARVIEDCRG